MCDQCLLRFIKAIPDSYNPSVKDSDVLATSEALAIEFKTGADFAGHVLMG